MSPGWVEAQKRLASVERLTNSPAGLAEQRRIADQYLVNPNQWSTPTGALCWGSFEIARAAVMLLARDYLDTILVPHMVEVLGLSEDLLSSGLGPATSRAIIDLLAAQTTTTSSEATTSTSLVPSTVTTQSGVGTVSSFDIEVLRWMDYQGGEGTEWLDAIDSVAGEEWLGAVRAGGVLPADVLRYAEALAATARTQAGKGVPDIRPFLDEPLIGSEDYWAFVELAKYDQNCLRVAVTDPPTVQALDIPDDTVPGSWQSTTTTVRSGSVSVSGSALSGILRAGGTDVGVGYSRPSGVGWLLDTTFTHDRVGYEVERLLWWPNGTVRLDVYPDGLDALVTDDTALVITPLGDPSTEYVWAVGDAKHLGDGADFVWDSTFTPEPARQYTVELRHRPDTPQR